MGDLNPRGLSTTDLAGLPHTRLGESRKTMFCWDVQFEHQRGQSQQLECVVF